jgi:hypothetical protein
LCLPVVGSCCGRAGAVDAGNPSTSGDGVRLVREAVSGVLSTDRPAEQGVLRLLSSTPLVSLGPECSTSYFSTSTSPWVFFLIHSLSKLGQVEEEAMLQPQQLPELQLVVPHVTVECALSRRDLSSTSKVSLNSSRLWVSAIGLRRGGDIITAWYCP